jgi:predicted nuclease with TOPRIM domain
LAKEAQKEKERLIGYNEQLTQSLENAKKALNDVEEKHHQQLNDYQTLHLNEINEYKRHIQQLENDNEQLKREEIVHIEPSTTTTDIQTITINNEEREQFKNEIQQLKQIIDFNQQQKEREYNDLKQKLTEEIDEYKKKTENLQTQQQSQENELKKEIERLQQDKNNELDKLRAELNEVKSTYSQSEERLHQEREKQRHILVDLLSKDLRNQLPNDNQDFDQWLSSYRQLFESSKQNLQEESVALKHENDQLHENMTDIKNQLKEIEKTLRNKEETLFTELKAKDAIVESIRNENDQLNDELQRLRNEIQRLQSTHDSSVSEACALKLQLDERFLAAATNNPSIVASDESFELVKQSPPSLSPIPVDIRAEQFNELIRSSKEALENQDSITQQFDKHLNDMHHSETGETSGSKVDESTVSSSSDQQS